MIVGCHPNGSFVSNFSRKCPDNTFNCGNTSQCINKSWVCDRDFDCPGGEDEKDCSYRLECDIKHMFKCKV